MPPKILPSCLNGRYVIRRISWLIILIAQATCIADEKAPFYADKLNLLFYLDDQDRRHEITTVTDWQRRRHHILTNFESVAGPFPAHDRSQPPAVTIIQRDELEKYVRTKLTFESETGDEVPAYLLVPKGQAPRLPAILCLHQTTEIAKEEPVGLGGEGDLHYAAELAERGYLTLTPDYPYLGENDFIPYENGYVSCTMKGIWNHMRAVDLLQSMPKVDPDRIGVIGHSLGGHNSIFVAAYDPRIKCVVSCCGYCTNAAYKEGHGKLPWYGKRYIPRLTEVSGEEVEKCPFDFSELIATLAPRPFLTVAPVHDKNFPLPGVKDCITATAPVYELYGVSDRLGTDYPDAGHSFPEASREKAYAWLDRWLRRARP